MSMNENEKVGIEDTYNLYIIKLTSETEEFYKIGVTTQDLNERCYSIPYECHPYSVYRIKGKPLAYSLEKFLLSIFEKYEPKLDFGGKTECVKSVRTLRLIMEPYTRLDCVEEYITTVSNRKASDNIGLKRMCEVYEEDPIKAQELDPILFEYIDKLGTDRVYSCGYRLENVTSLYNHEMSKSDCKVLARIYSTFKVNEVYPKSKVKDLLKSFGLEKAKATDLKNYFKVAETKVNYRKKNVNAFKIISKK